MLTSLAWGREEINSNARLEETSIGGGYSSSCSFFVAALFSSRLSGCLLTTSIAVVSFTDVTEAYLTRHNRKISEIVKFNSYSGWKG